MERLPDYISHIIWLDLQDSLTIMQQQELDSWLKENPYNGIIYERAKNLLIISEDLKIYQKFDADAAWGKFDKRTVSISNKNKTIIKKITPSLIRWIAASIVIIFSGIAITYFINEQKMVYTENNKVKIIPATKGALLTLSNGKKVLLDTIKNGIIELENGAVADIVDGQLSYLHTDNLNVSNNIATTSGRHYNMMLSDGTKVWLNANSSITFPSGFVGDTRNVKITGEVYFEVVKNKAKPFIVEGPKGLKIVVTGTKFNLNTYPDEDIWKTTLIEGRVNIHFDNRSMALTPGAQAQVNREKKDMKVIGNVDLERAIAWKNGLFNFEGFSLPEIMREIQRWYDIRVEYKGDVPKIEFFGEISRYENLDEIVMALRASGIKLKLDKERRLITIDK